MWISRKEYRFLKENAEKNINAECAILTAKENQSKAVSRAMEEYSAVLKERDELRLRVIELERGQRVKINPVDDAIDPSVVEAVKKCTSEYDHDWECCGVSSGGDEYRCRKCGARKTFHSSYSASTTISGV